MGFLVIQIIGAIGSVVSIIATQMKDKKKYLILYSIAYVFFIANMVLLEAYAGALNCLILMTITLISTKFENKKFPIWLAVIFAIIILIGNIITYKNIFSILPAIGSYLYLFILISKSMENIRISTTILKFLWAIYEYISKSYTTSILDLFAAFSSLIAIYRYDIKKHTIFRRILKTHSPNI